MMFMGFWGGMMGPGMVGHNMMGGYGSSGYGYGGGYSIIGALLPLLFIGLIIVGAYYLLSGRGPSTTDTSLNIIKERYAKGEITRKEYEQMKKDLSG